MKTQNIHDERRFKVNSIRNWLKSDPELEVSEMKTKFLAMGMDLEVHSINHSLKEALLLINREVIFDLMRNECFLLENHRRKCALPQRGRCPFNF